MLNAFGKTVTEGVQQIRERISGVRWSGDGIRFELDGVSHDGILKGRNADLLLTGVTDVDAGVAARVLLDGHASRAG